MMYDEQFKSRLIELREQKGVSARDMSLSIGQNPGYIHAIESGKALPSMSGFFYICDFLNISPKDFFDTENNNPEKLIEFISDLKKLEDEKLDSISSIVKGLIK